MKIKTITCHDVYNVGASLQAYALAKYLARLGHDVEIIDYKPDYLSNHFPLWGLNNPAYDKPLLREAYCLAKLPERLRSRFSRRKREFDSFTRNYLPVTAHAYHSNEELKAASLKADVFFAGSDQIWNTFFPNGKDAAFYLDFVPEDCIKASYAASFATETIPDEWMPKLKTWIKRLDHIAVRESSGVDILRQLGIDRAQQVLDPVFLLPQEAWSTLASEWKNPERSPYMLVYDFDRAPEMAVFAKAIAEERQLQIVSVLESPFFRRNYASEGPLAFLSLIRNAEVVISNSFHATAFSLIFQKQFWVFNRSEGINTRMRDLTKMVGIGDRLIEGRKSANEKIDYSMIARRLTAEIEKSKQYIDAVLGEVK